MTKNDLHSIIALTLQNMEHMTRMGSDDPDADCYRQTLKDLCRSPCESDSYRLTVGEDVSQAARDLLSNN
jgi:hypothetical protein